jgi:hypothetical protein
MIDPTPRATMLSIKASFDGRVFVPQDAVELPVGTQVEVVLPTGQAATLSSPRDPTADEQAEWVAIRNEISSSVPAFATVEEAITRSRKRP